MDLLTVGQIDRYTNEWEQITSEMLAVEQISGGLFVFGSEQACCKLKQFYSHLDDEICQIGFSTNLESWYFVVEQLPVSTSKQEVAGPMICPVLLSLEE